MNSQLKYKGWLKRVIKIPSSDSFILFTYSGRGIGTEKVIIEETECIGYSDLGWFVPRFEVSHNKNEYIVEVRVWPWFALRSITVVENGNEIYSEGKKPYTISRLTEIIHLILGLIILVGFPCSVLLIVSECIKYLG